MQGYYSYIIVGAGLSGASAVEGIRERDQRGSVLLLGAERDLPYDRPTLSKQLWTGGKTVADIVLHDDAYYKNNAVDVRLGIEVTQIDPAAHTIRDNQGNTCRYERLLLATGGTPRRLTIPGGDLEGISYYRTLERLPPVARRRRRGQIGAGHRRRVHRLGDGRVPAHEQAGRHDGLPFLGVGLARVSGVSGAYLTEQYRGKGVEVLTGDEPLSIQRDGGDYLTRTRAGREVRTDLVVAGIGITPEVSLARSAGLSTGNGVIVNEFLQTSAPDIYAAGDIALFPEAGFGPRRLEHWDNAVSEGKQAGRNMAGAGEPFTYVPFFFSDLFEFGYEAVGDIDSRLTTFADWQEENKTGVIYYLDGDRAARRHDV